MYPDNNRTKPTSTRPAVSMMNQNGRKSSETLIGKRQSPCDVQNTNSTPASSKNAIHSEEVKNGRLKFEIGTENRVKRPSVTKWKNVGWSKILHCNFWMNIIQISCK